MFDHVDYKGRDRFRFVFGCSYLGYRDWKVFGDFSGEVSTWSPGSSLDYERETYNGSLKDFERNVMSLDGFLRVSCSHEAAPADLVEAFNAWRAAKNAAWLDHWKANQDRYGPFDPASDLARAPKPLRAAFYDNGWKGVE
jgi:hypothetical protein